MTQFQTPPPPAGVALPAELANHPGIEAVARAVLAVAEHLATLTKERDEAVARAERATAGNGYLRQENWRLTNERDQLQRLVIAILRSQGSRSVLIDPYWQGVVAGHNGTTERVRLEPAHDGFVRVSVQLRSWQEQGPLSLPGSP